MKQHQRTRNVGKCLKAAVSLLLILLPGVIFSQARILDSVPGDQVHHHTHPNPADSAKKHYALEFNIAQMSDGAYLTGGDTISRFFNLNVTTLTARLHTERLGWWKGGIFKFRAMANYGQYPSTDYLKDIQYFNNAEGLGNRIYLYQLYYKQSLFNDKLDLLIGQQDLNIEFALPINGGGLMNSSFGLHPDISVNFPQFSTYPFTTQGFRAIGKITNNLSIMGAVFNGGMKEVEANKYGTNWLWDKENDGLFTMGEIVFDKKKDNEHDMLSIKAGGYKHTMGAESLNPDEPGKILNDRYGVYGIIDAVLFREKNNPEHGLGMFAQISSSPSMSNILTSYYSGGLAYTGLIKGRDEDILSVGYTSANLNKFLYQDIDGMTNAESVLDISYMLTLHESIVIQPDFQYLMNIGGVKGHNAAVFMIRVSLFKDFL